MNMYGNVFVTVQGQENRNVVNLINDLQSNLNDSGINVVDDDVLNLIETVCFASVTTLVCLIGIPTNIINCLVFWHQGLTDRMNLCLFCLALVDCLYLVFDFTMYSLSSFILFYDKDLAKEYYSKITLELLGVAYGLRTASGCITMVISIERCVCVVFPLQAATLVRTRTMGILVCLLVLLFQLAYLINPFTLVVSIQKSPSLKITLAPSQFYVQNLDFIRVFYNTFLGIIVPVATFVVVTVATTTTILKLRAAIKWREKTCSASSDNRSRQMALTKMLVLVSCLYIITMVPFVGNTLTRLFVAEYSFYGRYSSAFRSANAIVHVFPRINSAVDFFIYYCRSSKFRTVIITFLFPVKKQITSLKSSTIVATNFEDDGFF